MANLESPLAGRILAINMEIGQTITEDDELVIIESMKMENPIFNEMAGTVKEIKIKVGDRVQEGDILAVIE
jgi:Acetyl/propionyl-CoA carboxylase, alpha subunit